MKGGGINLNHQHLYRFPTGDNLSVGSAYAFTISRHHFKRSAVALLTGLAEGMDIHLYATSYTRPIVSDKSIEWVKIAAVDEAHAKISERSLGVVVDHLATRLAHEIRNLIVKGEQKTDG